MNRYTFNLLVEPSNQDYYDLLDYALAECEYTLLIVQNTIRFNIEAELVIDKLSSFLCQETQTNEWPGTRLINRQARVLKYYYTSASAEILKAAASRLYQWLQPSLPEDLCLLRADGNPWLVSISHENDGYFILSSEEKNRFFAVLPQYRLMVEEER